MRLLGLSLRYLCSRPLTAALNLVLLALGLASVNFLLLSVHQIEHAFERDLSGIDLVVGAKGSPIQLILAGVFHLDAPTGNIALADARALQADPRVARLIPLSLGDAYQGFRIVGTSLDYISHYQAELQHGALWSEAMQVVLGAEVARATGLRTGASFVGSHGLGGGAQGHAEHPFRVTGVLKPCACVLDRLVLTDLESVWQVHDKALPHTDAEQPAGPPAEITLALIQYRSPLAAMTLPRFVNANTAMQAAAPAVEISRLLRMLGAGADVLRGFCAVLLLSAGLSVFIALWNAVRERRHDLAMLRMLGASPAKVAGLVWCEALWLAAAASLLGLLSAHLLTALLGQALAQQNSIALSGWIWLGSEAWTLLLALSVATLAALLPAWSAYRVDVAELLNSR